MDDPGRGRKAGISLHGEDGAGCAHVRDALPLLGLGRLGPESSRSVDEHLRGCAACREERRLIERLRAWRPEPPTGLVDRVLAEARRPPRAGRRAPLLAAAAVAVVALGATLVWGGREAREDPASLALDPDPAFWSGEDWTVAGEPLLEGLSRETLLALLEEMEP